MEPTNNPMPTTNPVPPVPPVPPVAPEPVAPIAPEPIAPVAPVEPLAPVAPESVAPIAPEPIAPAPIEPTAPVITPGAPNPVANSPMFQQPDNSAILDTSPITMPEAPKAPDPIEEELKAPLTPAAPVPGSIGSAVSVPPLEGQQQNTPSVAFTDPAAAQATNMVNKSLTNIAKVKMTRTIVIMICTFIVGILVLGFILIAILNS